MNNYRDVYRLRLSRNSSRPQDRIQEGREKNFERFLKSSPHKVSFEYNGFNVEGVLEPHKQDQTKTLVHLLCRVKERFNPGDVIVITERDLTDKYMFYYWEERRDSGYNRWTMIKMNKVVSWRNDDGKEYTSDAFLYSKQGGALQNTLSTRSKQASLYMDNVNLDFMMIPSSKDIEIGSYLEINIGDLKRAERVTGFDFISTPGIMYVSMKPTFERDHTPMPEKTTEDDPTDFFWGGNLDGE